MLHDMTMPGAPPADPTNAHADDAAAAALGEQLFTDTSLSPTNTVSCATCHDPAKSYSDGKPQAVGVATGDRNAPSLLLASYAPWQFWDGRADSQWMQATGPFENAKEFNSSRLFIAHAISDRYDASYAAIFGALPDMSNATQFPASGKPGDASWTAMAPADQAAVTTIFTNATKSIEAFERTLRVQPNALDAYVGGKYGSAHGPAKTRRSRVLRQRLRAMSLGAAAHRRRISRDAISHGSPRSRRRPRADRRHSTFAWE
jgi:cytochrome c peroxidase